MSRSTRWNCWALVSRSSVRRSSRRHSARCGASTGIYLFVVTRIEAESRRLRGVLEGRTVTRVVKDTGSHTGPSPVDRGRAGSKHHLITDGHGTPLAVLLTGGNRNDVTQAPSAARRHPAGPRPCRPAPPRAGLPVRRPRLRPDIDRDQVRERGIVPAIARREHDTVPGWAPTAG